MFEVIRETHVDFMRVHKIAYVISGGLILAGIVSLIAHGGPRYSIDFAGGRLVELAFDRTVSAADVRSAVSEVGISGAEVQHFQAQAGGERAGVILRFKSEAIAGGAGQDSESPTGRIIEALERREPGLGVEVRREESVGPKVGGELRGRAVKAIAIALAAILIYVAIRYEFIFAFGAVIALLHDVFVTFGLFSIMNLEISLQIVAALLTIAGFSVNDTIVIFDRIREQRRIHQRMGLREIINLATNQTLSRTLITSGTVFLAVLALFLFGGPVIRDFSIAMLIGVVTGSYSTIFIASALALTIVTAREKVKKTRAAAAA
jgi:preprotein translocase SecF subunit